MSLRSLLASCGWGVALVCAFGWFSSGQTLRQERGSWLADTLDPVAQLLQENEATVRQLQAEPYPEGAGEFVGAYLIMIRRDGLARHSDMRQRINTVVDNGTAILALLAKYDRHARTPAFRADIERFRAYALGLRERWQSVPEIFMAGGNLALAAPPYPASFAASLDGERR